MKRTVGVVVACFVGLVASEGCADLRELNPCRAVVYAYCERALECDGRAYPSVDDCAIAVSKAYHTRAEYDADGTKACPSSASACVDVIAAAKCGEQTRASDCGDVLNNVVTLPSSTARSSLRVDNGESTNDSF